MVVLFENLTSEEAVGILAFICGFLVGWIVTRSYYRRKRDAEKQDRVSSAKEKVSMPRLPEEIRQTSPVQGREEEVQTMQEESTD